MNQSGMRLLEDAPALMELVDSRRLAINARLDARKKSAQGQFMTPRPVARFMASLFRQQKSGEVRLLDAGAGIGSLTAAFVEEFCSRSGQIQRISATAYENDPLLAEGLEDTLADCKRICANSKISFESTLFQQDFIEVAATPLLTGDTLQPHFTHAILNPPYKKIHSTSNYRLWLRAMGIEASNLYAGFLAITINLLAPRGELVAIVPRSFCNGPYFKPFRKLLLKTMTIRQLHIINSRTHAFQDDEVLQENIILYATKERREDRITISISENANFAEITSRTVPQTEVINPDDPDSFIHIVTSIDHQQRIEKMYALPCTLADLDLEVSTGPVVDFRLKEYLRSEPQSDTLPLLYPAHIQDNFIVWPIQGKKPNAIVDAKTVQKWLYPNGHYTVIRRFSSKEERRRVVAAIHDPSAVPGEKIGFENHLNVYHRKRQGLPPDLAKGLAVYLNSTFLDVCFRQFNGHTQVNVRDLYNLRYPSLAILEKWGKRVKDGAFPTQDVIDRWIEEELF